MLKKSSILFIFILILFAFISPASADYIGPDRDVTTYEVEEIDYGVWAKDDPTGTGCNHTSGTDCIVCEWEGSPGRPCGDAEYWYKLGTRYDTVAVTTTHPPATITGQLQNCILQNGWCVTSSQIGLNANEPLAGYEILLIEGIRNSEIFACGEFEATCQISLLEGINTLEYWAISSWGDSSRKGTTTVKVDTVAPNLNLLVNGTLGLNSWYVSNTIITAEGADDTSGIFEKVLSTDNGNIWIPSTTLSDGVYTVDIRITDNAYNVSTASTTLLIDTTTPILSLSVSGTKGNSNYYISKPKITVTTNDVTSSVALVQAKIDNGNWIDTNEITIEDGIHTYQFRVYDNAGNMTESSVGQIAVDTIPPSVEADEEINLGETVFYTLQDNGSGLAIERIVIEDEDEKYKKIVWLQNISGDKIEGDILWDGKFPSNTLGTSAYKTLAGVGEYYITFKISDQAGNETFYTTIVNVNPISYLQSIPEFIPPVSEEVTSNESTISEEESQSFGGNSTPAQQPNETQNLISLTGTTTAGASKNTTTSNILWGAGAMAVIGAATAYALEQQRQREEEEEQSYRQAQQQAEMLNQQERQRIINQWLEGQAILNAHIEQLESQGATAEQIAELQEQGATQGFGTAIGTSVVLGESLAQQQALADLQAEQNALAYQTYRQGEYVSVPIVEEQEKPLWQMILDPIIEGIAGVFYQAVVVNNLNPLVAISPAPESAKNTYFAGMETLEIDSTAFTIGRVVGGVLGIIQGTWEILSGIATGTGGTIVSCGTGVLCVGGGAASIAVSTALVTHGSVVFVNSAYQTGLQINALSMSLKKDSEMKSYEDAKKEGKIGEAEHIDDGNSSNPDFLEKGKGFVDFKKPVITLFRSVNKQASDIAKNISRSSSEVRFIIDLKNFTKQEKKAFIEELERLGTDMSRVDFINQ